MKTTPIATATAAAALAGLLLAACGGLPAASVATPTPQDATQDAITALERACLLDPMNAANWARLATALEADGQRERATRFYQQAATLSAHDARRDYALLAGAAAGTAAPAALSVSVPAAADAYAGMPRTQVQQIGAAMVQVVRVEAPALAARVAPAGASSLAAATATAASSAAPPDPVRLEISNGNGVTGAAASLARTLDLDGVTTVRLTNARPFTVPRTRIEYPHAQRALAEALSHRLDIPLKVRRDTAPRDVRIVLGHDSGRPK
ncbi:UNVERIFIED_ORG: LytR cell envelope-related transcriptional attenuator [Zoogloea ramigera]|uniref:LytR C-terminal domain-containing protein n=1 Tax=Duganella zoogloeoides TaxID=75659 RepID=A0ABZ0XYK1_9BURK|nr:LytR C-terminal domain-containing protein [Duganella zoogloeoides]WQH04337.1 LytR C-terminal domain-containing protein [Duganella zoogloeoides]